MVSFLDTVKYIKKQYGIAVAKEYMLESIKHYHIIRNYTRTKPYPVISTKKHYESYYHCIKLTTLTTYYYLKFEH